MALVMKLCYYEKMPRGVRKGVGKDISGGGKALGGDDVLRKTRRRKKYPWKENTGGMVGLETERESWSRMPHKARKARKGV